MHTLAAVVLATTFLPSPAPVDEARLMRLKVREGQALDYSLKVERQSPPLKADMRMEIKFTSVEGKNIEIAAKVVGMKINGRNRNADVKKILGDQAATLGYTDRCVRSGGMTGLSAKQGDPVVMGIIAEAGWYHGNFQNRAVKPGDSWRGSVTATGGCVGAQFTFKRIEKKGNKEFAHFEITEMGMTSSKQVGPMKMVIDLSSGICTYIEYTVRRNKSGNIVRFEQTLLGSS